MTRTAIACDCGTVPAPAEEACPGCARVFAATFVIKDTPMLKAVHQAKKELAERGMTVDFLDTVFKTRTAGEFLDLRDALQRHRFAFEIQTGGGITRVLERLAQAWSSLDASALSRLFVATAAVPRPCHASELPGDAKTAQVIDELWRELQAASGDKLQGWLEDFSIRARLSGLGDLRKLGAEERDLQRLAQALLLRCGDRDALLRACDTAVGEARGRTLVVAEPLMVLAPRLSDGTWTAVLARALAEYEPAQRFAALEIAHFRGVLDATLLERFLEGEPRLLEQFPNPLFPAAEASLSARPRLCLGMPTVLATLTSELLAGRRPVVVQVEERRKRQHTNPPPYGLAPRPAWRLVPSGPAPVGHQPSKSKKKCRCGRPLLLLAQLRPDDVAESNPRWLLQVYWCEKCFAEGSPDEDHVILRRRAAPEDRSRLRDGRELRLEPFLDYPGTLDAAQLVPPVDFDENGYRAFLAGVRGLEHTEQMNKVGGYPEFSQSEGNEDALLKAEHLIVCRTCEAPMRFFVQITDGPDTPIGGDCGTLTINACLNPKCDNPHVDRRFDSF